MGWILGIFRNCSALLTALAVFLTVLLANGPSHAQYNAANDNYRRQQQQQEQAARQRREQEQMQAQQRQQQMLQAQREQEAQRARNQAAQAQSQAAQARAQQLQNTQNTQRAQAQQAIRTQQQLQQQQLARDQKRREFQQNLADQRQRMQQGQRATAAAANAQAAATQARLRQIKENTRPPTPGEIAKGFTGRVVNGRALIRYKGRIVTVPASRVSGFSAKWAAQDLGRPLTSSTPLSNDVQHRLAALKRQTLIPSNNNLGLCGAAGGAGCSSPANNPQQRQNFAIGQPSNVVVSPRIYQRIGSVQAEKAALSTLDKKWLDENGAIKWPPNGGFIEHRVPRDALAPGTRIDRYGHEHGNYFSPADVPFEQRALPEAYRKAPLVTYEVVKELPVTVGTASAWFDQPGGGKQYKITTLGAIELEKRGYLKRID